jgi:GMP synthase-like glutamine amidotransferase
VSNSAPVVTDAAPVVLAIQNESSDPPLWVGRWLGECGIDVRVIAAHEAEPVPSQVPDGVSGLLALGGAMGANDDEVAPWLVAERALLRDAVDREVPVLGLCLGSQLLAAAHGGLVELGPVTEVGLSHVRRTEEGGRDPVVAAIAAADDGIPAAQWHQDHVARLPPEAVLLLTNDACRVQGFRLGATAYGLQLHPEVDPVTFASWASDADEAQVRSGRLICEAIAEVAEAEADLQRAWRPMAHAWAELVRAYAASR